MFVMDNRKFVLESFDSEDELEQVVISNAEHIFGPSSIYLPKSLIRTVDGAGTIPDGYAIDLEGKCWYLVEAEISKHSVWSHIAPQVAKQIIAANNPATKLKLIDTVINRVRDDESLQEKFADQNIDPIDYRHVLGEIIASNPIIGMPIDSVKNDLREWAATLKVDVRLWIVQKYVEFNNPTNIAYKIPDEFSPIMTTQTVEDPVIDRSTYNVTISDLLDEGFIEYGQKFQMPYKPRNGEQKVYYAEVLEDGSLDVLGRKFSALSYAALFGIQDSGSTRTSVNGWHVWKLEDGRTLNEIRENYLEHINPDS
ncbi:hypothetical protein [Rubinisphaera sp.]|uniref:restriction system modified-DNA reader domain-containing protein n=1 Tax=Rubinisphaera sp. TaxID=2024857 RepID=UPI000C10E883|nr:hypothetical protein [Rubinisphaera sp.]MBV09175.1 hypothetical protein [Rubinisphaera sp.]HCS54745.1 hypothetical protein [Planctomycetaceae bacterium]|tara:strand:+ start:1188 stop:2120 length:933 start_codon:yes stop_codon:yes gene_type:complete